MSPSLLRVFQLRRDGSQKHKFGGHRHTSGKALISSSSNSHSSFHRLATQRKTRQVDRKSVVVVVSEAMICVKLTAFCDSRELASRLANHSLYLPRV